MLSDNSGQNEGTVPAPHQKPGHFWELEAWMAGEDIKIRELAMLLRRKKTAISRVLCGQFVRVDPDLQADLDELTKGVIGDDAWKSFLRRRLAERQQVAA